MSKITTGWYKLFRPATIDDYIFQSDLDKDKFLKYIEAQDIPDLILHGHRGTGKTTLALILKNELNIADDDFLHLNASDDNSVGVIRELVSSFIRTMSVGKFKIVFLDEADALTVPAQKALKAMIEDSSGNARFILACNDIHKIIPEIMDSRCTPYEFKSIDRTSMKRVALDILLKMGMDLSAIDRDSLSEALDAHVELGYPDLRKVITGLEKYYNVDTGQLGHPQNDSPHIESLVELLMCIEGNNWSRARDIIYEDIPTSEIGGVYSFIDRHMSTITSDTDLLKRAYTTLALYAYRGETMVVPELNLTVCIIKLCEILGDSNNG